MLNPSSKFKGEKDMMKYEKARQLKEHIHKIREDYEADIKSKEMRVRQRSVALYFIDRYISFHCFFLSQNLNTCVIMKSNDVVLYFFRLALRAGNEKDEDQADTVFKNA